MADHRVGIAKAGRDNAARSYRTPDVVAGGNWPEVGELVYVDLAEMQVSGLATVRQISPAPELPIGPGRVVTGKFVHQGEVIDLQIEGMERPIGVTASHPFWSEDRKAFVPAGELRSGERLLTAVGTQTHVAHIAQRDGPQTVYNIEVDGEHVYAVSEQGLVVHNDCWTTARKNYWKQEAKNYEMARAKRPDAPVKYSDENLARMKEGKPPMMKVEITVHKTGKTKTVNVPMELHHTSLPQRMGTPKAHEPWNLTPATPWGHAGMDPHRHTGYTVERVINGTGTWIP